MSGRSAGLGAWFTTAAAAAAGLLLSGCQPEPLQWLVSVAADAPVPRFGDHLVLEVIGADARCTGCVRLIGIDGPDSLPVSFGVVPTAEGATPRLRARLYRAAQAGANGLPATPALIDATGKLPPLDGETRVALDLSMRCFGVESDPDQGMSCDPMTGMLAPEPVLPLLSAAAPQPRAGTWPDAALLPCPGTAPEGMVCVPGGVFLLGAPRPGFVFDSVATSSPEHLVKLHPFAMDVDEVTVGTVRSLLAQGQITGSPVARGAPTGLEGACTYLGASSGANDALPINCISLPLAEQTCTALGKRLPTEAEWEYAAGNLLEETQYPWGDATDLCSLALLGRGRRYDETSTSLFENSGCRTPDAATPWGPVAGGSAGDVTYLGIRNLAGSMIEWTADTFAPYTAPCWQPSGTLLVDPSCQTAAPGAPGRLSVRGSSWAGYKVLAQASARGYAEDKSGDPYTGFRCARSM